ncbi:hypothetical protein [Aeromicrobium sp. 50.2.37]|uniref:hypothetical protein n=1 Tax=Aeromicrobium sp. 50.2.37 TaxID=2969305 RepID=UPI00214F7E2F|nr:hypothetical protein [Aeromicrobium sp. 50.2.37]MCR4515021.1 hypothetical protein [Aeromicrobium sp. 50.2.37]
MKRLITATALAVASTVLAATPAQADTVSKVNCDGSDGSGLTATQYVAMVASKPCVFVEFDRTAKRGTAKSYSRPKPGQGAVTQLALFRRPCGGSWTRVAYAPDADGWFGQQRDVAQTSAAQGSGRVQWYASGKFSTRVNGTIVAKRLKTGVVDGC